MSIEHCLLVFELVLFFAHVPGESLLTWTFEAASLFLSSLF